MLFGGMWPVALTDFFRMIIIVVGMLYIGWVVSGLRRRCRQRGRQHLQDGGKRLQDHPGGRLRPAGVQALYWKRANTQGALFAIVAGVSSWLLLEIFHPDGMWPPQLFGLLMSLAGILVGSLLRPKRHA